MASLNQLHTSKTMMAPIQHTLNQTMCVMVGWATCPEPMLNSPLAQQGKYRFCFLTLREHFHEATNRLNLNRWGLAFCCECVRFLCWHLWLECKMNSICCPDQTILHRYQPWAQLNRFRPCDRMEPYPEESFSIRTIHSLEWCTGVVCMPLETLVSSQQIQCGR